MLLQYPSSHYKIILKTKLWGESCYYSASRVSFQVAMHVHQLSKRLHVVTRPEGLSSYGTKMLLVTYDASFKNSSLSAVFIHI